MDFRWECLDDVATFPQEAIKAGIGSEIEHEFVKYVRSARVYLSDGFKGLSVEVGLCGSVKVTDMFICV